MQEDGATRRAHLEAAAASGSATARAALEGPDIPDCVLYLRGWLLEVTGRSGVGMAGAAPLSYGTIRDWAALTGRTPNALEIEALFRLDRVLRNPD